MRICSFFLAVLVAAPVFATDANGNYAIWGLGASSCVKYTTERAANNDNNYRQYLMGYLTSYNHQADETYSISNIMTMDEILGWIDSECELKPTFSFEQVVIEYLLAHYEKRARHPPGGFGR